MNIINGCTGAIASTGGPQRRAVAAAAQVNTAQCNYRQCRCRHPGIIRRDVHPRMVQYSPGSIAFAAEQVHRIPGCAIGPIGPPIECPTGRHGCAVGPGCPIKNLGAWNGGKAWEGYAARRINLTIDKGHRRIHPGSLHGGQLCPGAAGYIQSPDPVGANQSACTIVNDAAQSVDGTGRRINRRAIEDSADEGAAGRNGAPGVGRNVIDIGIGIPYPRGRSAGDIDLTIQHHSRNLAGCNRQGSHFFPGIGRNGVTVVSGNLCVTSGITGAANYKDIFIRGCFSRKHASGRQRRHGCPFAIYTQETSSHGRSR